MNFIQKTVITESLATRMIEAAKEKAKQLHIAVNIAIVDDGGNLVAFSRMDGAPLLSVGIAQNKAYTAAAFGLPTHEWHGLIKDHDALREGIVHTDRLVIFGGGYPIVNGNSLAGAIGVSGGSEEEDMACCEAAFTLLKN